MMVFKKCHVCGFINEKEIDSLRCEGCAKPLLPLGYFHRQNHFRMSDQELACTDHINQDYVIKGLAVLWDESSK